MNDICVAHVSIQTITANPAIANAIKYAVIPALSRLAYSSWVNALSSDLFGLMDMRQSFDFRARTLFLSEPLADTRLSRAAVLHLRGCRSLAPGDGSLKGLSRDKRVRGDCRALDCGSRRPNVKNRPADCSGAVRDSCDLGNMHLICPACQAYPLPLCGYRLGSRASRPAFVICQISISFNNST